MSSLFALIFALIWEGDCLLYQAIGEMFTDCRGSLFCPCTHQQGLRHSLVLLIRNGTQQVDSRSKEQGFRPKLQYTSRRRRMDMLQGLVPLAESAHQKRERKPRFLILDAHADNWRETLKKLVNLGKWAQWLQTDPLLESINPLF